jgi:nicotinate phosphoribosyltransferase
MTAINSPLLTDLYQFTMLQAYFDRGMRDEAVFEFFVRKLPVKRNFFMAAGLTQLVEYLEGLRFSADDLAALEATELFHADFLTSLESFRFEGDLDAMREGSIFFANEPIVRVTAPLPQAQLIESRLVNILHCQSLIASKAARGVLAAAGKPLIDFGMRRAHGSEAALFAARASYLAGFAGTATVLARPRFGIPIFGTMAHSFIQSHDTEEQAFEHFCQSHRGKAVLLIDTYDTETGAQRVVELAQKHPPGTIHSVRLDSGDLDELSRRVRKILDDGGCGNIGIFASGGLDELKLQKLIRGDAPIDGFGIGTSLDVSEDCPALDCVYKMQEYAGSARRKRSTGKATWPGRKQVYRDYDEAGRYQRDTLTVVGDSQAGEALLEPVLRGGQRVCDLPNLDAARAHAEHELGRLPAALRSVETHTEYLATVSPALQRLADEVDRSYY